MVALKLCVFSSWVTYVAYSGMRSSVPRALVTATFTLLRWRSVRTPLSSISQSPLPSARMGWLSRFQPLKSPIRCMAVAPGAHSRYTHPLAVL